MKRKLSFLLRFQSNPHVYRSQTICTRQHTWIGGVSVTGVLLHPPVRKPPVTERLPIHVCKRKHGLSTFVIMLFAIKEMRRLIQQAMAAANVPRDVLKMFYGPIEENQRLRALISPSIGGFEIVRNNFNQLLRVWKMQVRKKTKKTCSNFSKKRKIHSYTFARMKLRISRA